MCFTSVPQRRQPPEYLASEASKRATCRQFIVLHCRGQQYRPAIYHWKEDDLNYYLQRVGAYLLSDPEHFKNFRKQVRNILDWGKGHTLDAD